MNTLKPSVCLLKSIAYCLLSAAFLFSCSQPSPVREQLSRAEQVMETDSRAAALVLDSIDSSALRGEDAALYAILRTQTDYKRDIPLTSDSLARIATDYYGTSLHKNYHAAMAWYTLGCVYKETIDDINGTAAFLKAKSLFPDTLIRYYALSEQNLALHYINRNMNHEAIQELQSAKQNLIRLGDSATVAFMDYKLGQSTLYLHDHFTAKKYFEAAINNPYARKANVSQSYYELAKVETYDLHDYAKALEHLDYNISHTSGNKLAGTYNLKAVIFQELGQLDSAWHYYNRSLSCYPNHASFAYDYLKMASLAPQVGKADSIDYYIQMHDWYTDSLYYVNNQQAIRQVANDHRHELERQQMALQKNRLHWTWGILSAFLVMTTGIVILLNDRRRKSEKLKYEKELDDIKRRYILENVQEGDADEEESSGDGKDAEEREENAVPLPPRFFIQQERLRLYRRQYDASEWARYFRNRQLEIEEKQMMPENDSKQFLRFLDNLFIEMHLDMAKDNPNVNHHDLDYCAMTLLEFGVPQIAYVKRTSPKYCYNRRYRLQTQMTEEWYLFVFGKSPEKSTRE